MEAHSNMHHKFPKYYCFSDKCLSCQQQNQLRHRPHGPSFVLIKLVWNVRLWNVRLTSKRSIGHVYSHDNNGMGSLGTRARGSSPDPIGGWITSPLCQRVGGGILLIHSG